MAPRRRWLVATNLVLAAGIVVAATTLPATGRQNANRVRGQYTLLAGEIRSGGDASGIYIIDSVNEEMVVVRWDDNRGVLAGLDYRSLSVDTERRPGR